MHRLGDRAAALTSAVSLALVESDEELGTLLLRVRDAARVATLDRLEAKQYWQATFGEAQVPRVASALEDLTHAMRQRKGNASLLSVPQNPALAR